MEAFLRAFLPRVLPADRTFDVHPFQGKADLLARLEARLRAYASWIPESWRILVIVERDDDDCRDLKRRLEDIAQRAVWCARTGANKGRWRLANCIAIEELEAWCFGDWNAVRGAYPRAPANVVRRRGFRDPDAIMGGTWEAFERVMQRCGYFAGELTKLEAARAIGSLIDPARSASGTTVVCWRKRWRSQQ